MAANTGFTGDRLWIAPEFRGITDLPDNEPVEISVENGWTICAAPVGNESLLQREIRARATDHRVQLEHRIYNRGKEPVECALWCLTVMARW